uniref:Calponin-homology (CH) domain-containing protein n=1 Tax=Globodera rostochiensis TaxID=31243 RepID=A0A914HU78_GLORO
MYTEILELVNFFARFFHLRIPRLKIGMFCEHFANNCFLRFHLYWNLNQPKQYEELRIIRVSHQYTDELFTSAASAVGLQLDELLSCIPERLIIVYVNPGEVFYCPGDYSPPVAVWVGPVCEDLKYNETCHVTFPPPPIPSSILPTHAIQPLIPRPTSNLPGAGCVNVTVDFSVLSWRIPLGLVHPRELGYATNPTSDFLMFRYCVPGTPNYTVETFASTRFGSYRKRPDYEFFTRLQHSLLLLNAQSSSDDIGRTFPLATFYRLVFFPLSPWALCPSLGFFPFGAREFLLLNISDRLIFDAKWVSSELGSKRRYNGLLEAEHHSEGSCQGFSMARRCDTTDRHLPQMSHLIFFLRPIYQLEHFRNVLAVLLGNKSKRTICNSEFKAAKAGMKEEALTGRRQHRDVQKHKFPGSNSELIPVYTKWANDLLQAADLPPLTDLSGELCMPLKLIVLIHSITFEFQKVPKEQLIALLSHNDALISIKQSLAYLCQIGVPLIDSIQAKDIRNGHLGAILQLLYQLSLYHCACQQQLHRQRPEEAPQQKQWPNRSIRPSSAGRTCYTTASSSTITPTNTRTNNNLPAEEKNQWENRTVETSASRKVAFKMPPDASLTSLEGANREGTERKGEEQEMASNVRLSRIASTHRSALRPPQISAAVSSKRSVARPQPIELLEAPKALGTNSSRLVPPSSQRSSSQSANTSPKGLLRGGGTDIIIDFVPPALPASKQLPPAAGFQTTNRICLPIPTVLTPEKKHSLCPEVTNRNSGRNSNGGLSDESKRTAPEGPNFVEASIVCNSSSQHDSSVSPTVHQQLQFQKSVLRQPTPSALAGRSKSALRVPISSIRSVNPTSDELNEHSPKQTGQSLPQHHHHSSSSSTSVPVLVSSSSSLPTSASSSLRTSQLRPPIVSKPVPPKRHTSTVIRSSEERLKEEPREGEATEMNRLRLFGGKDRERERKREKVSAPICIGPPSTEQHEAHQMPSYPPRGKDLPDQNGEINKLRKPTSTSKSLLMPPSSTVSRRVTATAGGGVQPTSGRAASQQLRSGETAKRGAGGRAGGGGGTTASQQMNTSQCSTSSNGGRKSGQLKKYSQTPPSLMTTSSSSSSVGIRITSKPASSNSKLTGIPSAKKTKEELSGNKTDSMTKEEETMRTEQQKCQAANSPPTTEKKPILAVKGISVPSGGTPSPAQKRPSLCGGRPSSADSASECPRSPLMSDSRRNPHMVVGVVSPMMHQQEEVLGGTSEANRSEERSVVDQQREKDNPSECEPSAIQKPPEEPIVVNSEMEKWNFPEQMLGLSDGSPPIHPEKVAKISKLAKAVPAKRLIIPTMASQILPEGTMEEQNIGGRKVPSEKCRGEECPSPSVPPSMAPTKLMSVLREEQASPCPSSSLSTPAEEETNRCYHFDKDHPNHRCQDGHSSQQHQKVSPDELISAAVATASDNSTDSVRTTIQIHCFSTKNDQLGELLGDCAIIGGGTAPATAEDNDGQQNLHKNGKGGIMGQKMDGEEGEGRRKMIDSNNGKQQLATEGAGKDAVGVISGGATSRNQHHYPDNPPMSGTADYASESELDFRRQPMARHLYSTSIPAGNKLVMALDLRPNSGTALRGGGRKSRFRESYEDSSSLSSGLSEPFDDDISTDDLTGSSSDYLLGQLSPNKMRQFAHENGQKHIDFVSFQKPNGPQPNSMVSAAERERQTAGQLLQKCKSAQRGCAYFGSAGGGGPIVDPHRPSTSNGYLPTPAVGHFVHNSAEGRRSGCDQHHRIEQSQHPQKPYQHHPNEQLFALREQGQQHRRQQQQQPEQQNQQQFDLFRPYHTITAVDWPPLQYQQQQQLSRTHRPVDARRLLSPPHNLMVLSDDGDTLSVAAGDVGERTTRGQSARPPGATLLGTQQQTMAATHLQNADLLHRRQHHQQHPAYHTHSLDRHAHLRVLSAGVRPLPAAADDHSPRQGQFANISRNLPHQRLQLNSLLISPRHHYSVNGYTSSTFAPPGNTNATSSSVHRRSRGGDLYGYSNGPLLPPQCFPPPPPPGSSARSSVASGTPHQRSASLSAMSRSMVTVLEQHEERQRRRGRGDGGETQRRVLEYVRGQLEALNSNARGDVIEAPPADKSAKSSHPPLPIPPQQRSSPHLNRRTPLSLPRQLELNNNHLHSAGSLSARGTDGRIYSNLKFPNSGVNSPTRLPIQQPGSQLSLASSIGSTYSTIEERYEWEIGKLQNELESYRTHVQLLSQKNSGFNCVIQMFDNRLQSIMLALGKLQQKQNVKRDEVERLCNEIEQLRALSVTAGVVPFSNMEGAACTLKSAGAKGDEQQQNGGGSNKKSWKTNVDTQIRSSFNRAFHKGTKKSKQQQQQLQPLKDTTDNTHSSFPSSFLNLANNNNSSSSSMTSKMDSTKRELETRELALTDVQLDALDKAKEIDILRETVNRLQHENKLLKYNFSLLERRVHSESRASSHLSLNTTCMAGPGLDFDAATLEEVLVEAPEQLAALYDLAASSPSSGDISVNTTTTGSSANGAQQFVPAELANKSTDRSSFASSTTSSKRSSRGPSTALPSAKVVLCVDLSGRLDSPHPLGHLMSLPPSNSLCSISRANSGSSSTLSSQASSSLGSVMSGAAMTSKTGGTARRELTVGYLPLPVGSATSWKDLDQKLGLLLEEYLHRIDPDLSLGIDSYSSIIGYQIHPTQQQSDTGGHSEIFLIRRRGSVSETGQQQQLVENCAELGELLPKLSPAEALQPGTLIRIRLKGVVQHSVDALVLESLFPRHLLEQLLYQLEQHRRLLLFGPTGIGKSNLARLLAKYLLMRLERNNNNNPNTSKALVDIRFPMDGEKHRQEGNQQQKVKEQLIAALRPASNTAVLVMDNLQWKRLGTVLEAFNNSAAGEELLAGASVAADLPLSSPFVICTLNRTCVDHSPVQQLQLHHNFRLFALSYKMDAVNGYLGRYLRRRLAEQELSSYASLGPPALCPSPADPLESVLHFLGRSLRAVNEFIERAATGGPDLTLGPRVLLQCPLSSEEAQGWFVQLWNDKLVPYMRKVLTESKAFPIPAVDGDDKVSAFAKDPTDEIGTLWPWTGGKEQLLKICQ